MAPRDKIFFLESDHEVWDKTLNLSWERNRIGKVFPLTAPISLPAPQKISAVELTYNTHFD